MHYFENRIIHLKNDRKVFGPGCVHHAGDTSKDDYRFLSRWGRQDISTNSLPHSFTDLHFQSHTNIF